MIKHVVCFKLKEPTEELLAKTKDILLSMQGNVPQVKGIFVGIDRLHSARSFDVILEVVVENMAQLEAYQKDEYHCSVVKTHMHAVQEKSIAIDCEL